MMTDSTCEQSTLPTTRVAVAERGNPGRDTRRHRLVATPMHDPVRKAHTKVFEDAWRDLAFQCHDTIAPEAAYQAWLAHFAICRLTPVHVVREVDFGARYLGDAAAAHFKP